MPLSLRLAFFNRWRFVFNSSHLGRWFLATIVELIIRTPTFRVPWFVFGYVRGARPTDMVRFVQHLFSMAFQWDLTLVIRADNCRFLTEKGTKFPKNNSFSKRNTLDSWTYLIKRTLQKHSWRCGCTPPGPGASLLFTPGLQLMSAL